MGQKKQYQPLEFFQEGNFFSQKFLIPRFANLLQERNTRYERLKIEVATTRTNYKVARPFVDCSQNNNEGIEAILVIELTYEYVMRLDETVHTQGSFVD